MPTSPTTPCGNIVCDYTVKRTQVRITFTPMTLCHVFTYWSRKAFIQSYCVNDIHTEGKSQSATQVLACIVKGPVFDNKILQVGADLSEAGLMEAHEDTWLVQWS